MTPEQALRKCHEPLGLSPMARMAFADRQAKLIRWGHNSPVERGEFPNAWPNVRWYNDEDFCRAYNTAVQQADRANAAEARVAEFEAKYIEQLNRANHESAEHHQYAREYQVMSAKCDRLQARVEELAAEVERLRSREKRDG